MLTVRRWLARPQGENGISRRRFFLFRFNQSKVCTLMCLVCVALTVLATHQAWAARSETEKFDSRVREFSTQAAQLVTEMNNLKTAHTERNEELDAQLKILSGKLDQIVRQLQER